MLSSMHSLLKFTKIVLECGKREEVWPSPSESTFNGPPPSSPPFPRPPHLSVCVLDPSKERTPAGMGGANPKPCWLTLVNRLGAGAERAGTRAWQQSIPSSFSGTFSFLSSHWMFEISFNILGPRNSLWLLWGATKVLWQQFLKSTLQRQGAVIFALEK